METGDVAGCRVLVVEDETLIAVLIEDMLAAMECEIVGPIGKLETAIQTAKEGSSILPSWMLLSGAAKFTR